MLLPVLPSKKFLEYEKAENEEQLFAMLTLSPSKFIEFFILCSDDETWCNTYPKFIEESLKWLTEQLLNDKIDLESAKMAAQAIQKHHSNLSEWLPLNILCSLPDGHFVINSFLFQSISLTFFRLIHENYFHKEKPPLELKTPLFEFKIIQEYIYTGEVKELWRHQESEILKIIAAARGYELEGLEKSGEDLLLRYVNQKNLMDFVKLSEKYHLPIIKKKCCELFNELQSNVILISKNDYQLGFEMTMATQTTLEDLTTWAPFITHFIAGQDVMENKELIDLLNHCRKLTSLDLGKTEAFNPLMLEIQHVKELILAGCFWLNDEPFKRLIKAFSQLQKLDLTSCNQISAIGWGHLTELKFLRSLNLSRCEVIDHESFELILASVRHLDELILNECRNLSKESFHALAMSRQPLIVLDLGRTDLSDEDLLQIVSRMPTIQVLDLARCQSLTEPGILDALKMAPSLKEVNLSHTAAGPECIEALRKTKPNIQFSQ